jgi:hypothetical protein
MSTDRREKETVTESGKCIVTAARTLDFIALLTNGDEKVPVNTCINGAVSPK